MNASVTRITAPPRKPNRRPGAVPAHPDTIASIEGIDVRRRAAKFAAAYRHESGRRGMRTSAAGRP